MNIANREFVLGLGPLEIFPWLRCIPGLTYLDSWKKASNTCYDYFKAEVLEKRRQSGSYRTEPTDFADYFLQEIDKSRDMDPNYITDETFLVCMRDLIYGGSDTTNSAMEHGILHRARNLNVQKKVQNEIDKILAQSVAPSYDDRLSMPYTQATIWEILRHASPVPFTSRSPLSDSRICDYHVPKGSICGINIYSIHRSKEIWDDPQAFRPERFLNAQLNEIVNTEKIIPFGYGRRVCIGETVARTTLFIFFVSLMQKFTFELSDKHPPPSLRNIVGLSRCPIPYHVTIRPREAKEKDGS